MITGGPNFLQLSPDKTNKKIGQEIFSKTPEKIFSVPVRNKIINPSENFNRTSNPWVWPNNHSLNISLDGSFSQFDEDNDVTIIELSSNFNKTKFQSNF